MPASRQAALRDFLVDVNNTRMSRGIFSALVKMLKIIKGHLFFCSDAILFARSLEGVLPGVQLGSDLIVREATEDDLHLFEPTNTPSEMMYLKTALEGEANCLIALKDNQLAAYVWFTPKVDPSVQLFYLPLAQDEMYVFDGATLPAFRRQGIQSVLHKRMFQLLRERGYRRVFGLVGVGNYPSLQLTSALYRVIGRVIGIKVFRLMYFRYHPELPGGAGRRCVIKWLGV